MGHLRKYRDIKGRKIAANDGEFGKVMDIFFEERKWAVRYLVVRPGGILSPEEVLISPIAVDDTPEESESIIRVYLTKEQIENSPSYQENKPISKEYELEYYRHYGWPTYWGFGAGIWGSGLNPADLRKVKDMAQGENIPDPEKRSELRSSAELSGYNIKASDGDIGHVEDFIIDTSSWMIRYLVIDTRNWLPGGKKVMLSPEWSKRIDWASKEIEMGLSKKSIENAPEYKEEETLGRGYEEQVHEHYEKQGYWIGHL